MKKASKVIEPSLEKIDVYQSANAFLSFSSREAYLKLWTLLAHSFQSVDATQT